MKLLVKHWTTRLAKPSIKSPECSVCPTLADRRFQKWRRKCESKEKENQTFRGSLSARARAALPLGSSACETPRKNCFSFSLPRPMLHSKNFNFSFSGLKTAVLYLIRDLGGIEKISEETKAKIALEFENAAIECLVYKTQKALQEYKIKTLIVAGGVSANKYLRSEMTKLAKKEKVKLLFPPQELTGDNSIMIGIAGYLNYLKNKKKVPTQQNSVVVSGRITTGILTRPVSVAFMSRSRGTRYSTSIDGRGDYAISLLGNDTYNVVVYYGGIFGNATSPDCDSHVLALNGNADMANLTLSC